MKNTSKNDINTLYLEISDGEPISIYANKKEVIKQIENCKSEYYSVSEKKVRKRFFNDDKKVKNVFRGKIIKNKKGEFHYSESENKSFCFNNSKYNDHPIEKDKEKKSIIIILESPHEKEYDKGLIPIAPAQGNTGVNIKNKICNVLNEIPEKDKELLNGSEYRLLIINPVPFQTSLFELHGKSIKGMYKTLRNNVWKTLWFHKKELKTDFKTNILNSNPVIILNCCTADLTDKIGEELISYKLKNVLIYRVYHPSCWYRHKEVKLFPLS